MKTVLVTGGAGFLGSHLCNFFFRKGYRVICIDNLITGSAHNIEHLRSSNDFVYFEHDMSFPIHIDGDVHYILHFASPASPLDYQKIPIETLKVGSLGTLHALGFAKAKKAVFLLASTSEVYGDPLVNPQPETYWGNVNPIGVRGCFSHDTEVLTENGWKYFSDLYPTEKILTLGRNDTMVYQKPTEVIKERYNGQLIHFYNTKIDLLVTPNHKMYAQPRGTKEYTLIESFDSIRWNRAKMKKSALWSAPDKKYFSLPPIKNSKSGNVDKIDMDLWLEFVGYYITEGCFYIRKRKQIVDNKVYDRFDYSILIAQDKKRASWHKIRACLKKLPFTVFDSDDHQFRICNKQLVLYLQQFGKSHEKFLPSELKNVSKRQLRILFDAMMLGDGASDGSKYYSSSYKLISDFQEILLKVGMAGTIRLSDMRKNRPVYSIHILTDKKKNYLSPLYPERKIVDYDGYVYCVTVPNRIIFVRRNGKALFCGNCYDEAKRFAEALTMAYHRVHGLNTKIVRIFNTYGSRMRKHDGRVIPALMTQALIGEGLSIFGDGSQTRSFCYVDDLVRGIYALMLSDLHEPVNIGNPEEYTVLELAKLVLEVTKSTSTLTFHPLPQDDPKVRRPDITLAREKLGWEPTIGLRDGLLKTLPWFQNS